MYRSIKLEQWNTEKESAYPVSDYAKNLNQFLEQQRHLVFVKQEELISKRKIISARSLKNAYIGKDSDDERTILKTYDERNAKLKLRIGKDAARFTYVRHVTARNHLERFINQKYGLTEYYLKDVDPEFFNYLHSYFLV